MQKYPITLSLIRTPRLLRDLFPIVCVATLVAASLVGSLVDIRSAYAAGTIEGTVFRDHNYNGLQDGTDVGVANISVTVYDPSNTVQGTATTASDGSYSLSASGTGPYRVEFSTIPSFLQPGVHGDGAGTTVQFVADGNTSDLNLALHNPADYCQSNPDLAIACYENGSNIDSTGKGFVSFSYDSRGGNEDGTPTDGYVPPTGDATIGEVGTVWGTAYQRGTELMYAASFIKRHSGLVDSPSTVYVLDYGMAGVPVDQFALQGVTPANGGSAIDLGSLCRRSITDGEPNDSCAPSGVASDYALPDNNQLPNVDLDAFDSVGKISYGDIEIDETDNTLWLVNLNQKALISVDVSDPDALPGTVNQYLIDGLTGAPSCTNGQYRPWGLGFEDGFGYLGGVCTAENGGSDADLVAFVHRFDPANVTAGLTEVVSFQLDYNRELGWEAVGDDQHWNPWTATWPAIGGTREDRGVYPQPIVSDIEFAADGSMILGIMDRWSHQTSGYNYEAVSGSTEIFESSSVGDIVHLCNNDGSFVLEGESSGGFTCEVNEPQMAQLPSGHTPVAGDFETDDGPSENGEYYPNDNRKGLHTEISLGALASLKQAGTVASVVIDPWLDYDTNGIHWYNTSDGIAVNAYEIVPAITPPTDNESAPSAFGKAAGLGDLQLICDPAPIEIGNRVWLDTNGNGIQDADETPIEGVAVTLYDATGTTEIATAVTDASGEYYFNSSNVPGGLATNTTYQVRIDLNQSGQATNALAGYIPTQNDATSSIGDGNDDSRDSDGDATIDPNFSIATITTGAPGANDHTIDFGFTQLASIGDTVWFDANANGIQDGDIGSIGGEEGVDAVTVNLYNDSDELIDTTTTNTSGFYEFTGLTPGDYYVVFDLATLPEGTTVTSQDVGGNAAADDLVDSDGAVDTGRTATTTLDPGENDPSWDLGIYELASIGDFVWFDSNGNGIQDAGETGVDGVTVELFSADGVSQGTVLTANGGLYEFTELIPSDYYVVFDLTTLPADSIVSPQDIGGNATADKLVDSDADPNTGRTATTTLDAGENDPSWDLGIYEPAAIGNFVWFDADSNGIQDAGEVGVNGVAVELFSADDISQGTTQTVNGGFYEFANLTPGDYYLRFTLPDGTSWTQASAGNDDRVDSDAAPTVDATIAQTEETELIAGENDDTWDAGLVVEAAITLEKQVQDPANSNAWVDADTVSVLYSAGAQAKYRFVIENSGTTALTTVTLDDPTPGLSGCPSSLNVDLTSVGGVLDPAETVIVEPTACLSPILPDGNFTNLANVSGVPSLSDGTPIEDSLGLASGTIPPVTDEDPANVSTSPLASIGDTVWFDANANGVQDDGEVGVRDVTVTLLNSAGAIEMSMATGDDGNYLFAGLTPGDYSVRFTLPNGTSWTIQDAGSVPAGDTSDSDVNPTTGETIQTTLELNESDLTWDAGIVIESAIELEKQVQDPDNGSIWHDADSSPVLYPVDTQARYRFVITNTGTSALTSVILNDPTAGVSGCPANLAVDLNDTSISDGDGILASGESIIVEPPNCLSPAFDNNGFVNTATVSGIASQNDGTPLESALGLPAGTIAPVTDNDPASVSTAALAAIGDKVWLDANANGIQDANEPGIAGVTVQLFQPGNQTPLTTTTTDSSGMYSFAGLQPGDYSIQVIAPDNYTITAIDAGTDEALDSDVDPTSGQAPATTLTEGENDPNWDAGLISISNVASLGNFVWLDENANGIQDEGEEGIENVVVVLYDLNGNVIDTMTTDADGRYLFSDLEPGQYYVQFNRPNEVQYFFSPAGASEDGTDSDAETSTGRTVLTDLIAGENDLSWDAGIYAPPLLSVTKVVNDGTIQPGDPINYTLTYENTGLSTAIDATITEVVPQHTTWNRESSSDGWRCEDNRISANTTCTYPIGDIPPLSQGSLTLTFVVDADQLLPDGVTEIQNEAFISNDGPNGTVLSGQSSGIITVPIERPTALDQENEPNDAVLIPHIYIPFVY